MSEGGKTQLERHPLNLVPGSSEDDRYSTLVPVHLQPPICYAGSSRKRGQNLADLSSQLG